VTRALSATLKRIAAQHPSLGKHFESTIRTGFYCVYMPDDRVPSSWEL
jgi:hypothetical protein